MDNPQSCEFLTLTITIPDDLRDMFAPRLPAQVKVPLPRDSGISPDVNLRGYRMTREGALLLDQMAALRESEDRRGECICVGVGEGQVGLPYRIQIQIQNRANQVPRFPVRGLQRRLHNRRRRRV